MAGQRLSQPAPAAITGTTAAISAVAAGSQEAQKPVIEAIGAVTRSLS
jgi:hypothetical protein